MILDDIGRHVEFMNKPSGSQSPTPLYGANTKDDVYMDENANLLTMYIPTDVPSSVQADTSTGSPIFANSTGTVSVDDSLANLLLGVSS